MYLSKKTGLCMLFGGNYQKQIYRHENICFAIVIQMGGFLFLCTRLSLPQKKRKKMKNDLIKILLHI